MVKPKTQLVSGTIILTQYSQLFARWADTSSLHEILEATPTRYVNIAPKPNRFSSPYKNSSYLISWDKPFFIREKLMQAHKFVSWKLQ